MHVVIGPLSRRVRAKPAEPAHALLARLALRNRTTLDGVARYAGADADGLRRGEGLDRLGAIAGVDVDALRRCSPARASSCRTVTLGWATMMLGDWTTASRRRCPECLAQDRLSALGSGELPEFAVWQRPEWDVRSVFTCVAHGTLLTDRCPTCGSTVHWSVDSADRCQCGADLSIADPAPAESAVDAVFVAAIRCERPLPPQLANLPLGQSSGFLERLGSLSGGWHAARPAGSMAERVITRDRGWSLLRAGASAIDARLNGIVEQAPGKRGLHEAYGWLWGTWLGVPSPNPLVAWLAALVRTNAVRHGVIAPFEGEGGTVSLREAGAMFGVGHARARRIVEELGLVHPASRQGVALALDRAAVTAAARSMDRV
ncbi:MAG: hypothetical protein EOP59_15700, partial [Sphingomonadales bacterium]